MSVSLEAVKSVPVQLMTGDEDLGVDSHRCVYNYTQLRGVLMSPRDN